MKLNLGVFPKQICVWDVFGTWFRMALGHVCDFPHVLNRTIPKEFNVLEHWLGHAWDRIEWYMHGTSQKLTERVEIRLGHGWGLVWELP
jgi:hypothetical protein